MDQNTSTPITAEFREKVYDVLGQVMLQGLDSGSITVEESKEMSQFIPDHLDVIQTQAELAGFLTELSNKWLIYKSVAMQFQDDSLKQIKIESIKEDINQINNQ